MKDKLFKAFCLGVDYGQLLAEEERDSEDAYAGFLGHCHDNKHSMPMPQNKRRQPRSEKWREEKRKAKKLFLNL